MPGALGEDLPGLLSLPLWHTNLVTSSALNSEMQIQLSGRLQCSESCYLLVLHVDILQWVHWKFVLPATKHKAEAMARPGAT